MERIATAGRHLALIAVGVVVISCAEPLEFADWTVPVPAGTRVVEFAGVPDEERAGRIELVEDVGVGGNASNPNERFYRPAGVTVDAAGRIYVLDRGNYRVSVFDADGGFITSWGRQGEGPGEFPDPRWIAVVGDQVAVLAGGQRLSTWRLGDGHLADHRLLGAPDVGAFAGSPAGTLAVSFHTYPDAQRAPDARRTAVGLFTLDGRETTRLGKFDDPSSIFEISPEGVATGLNGPMPAPSIAVSPGAQIYVTASDEYQVLAVSPAGEPAWALRAAVAPRPMSAERRDAWLAPMRERFSQVVRFDVDWPEREPALAGLQVDGHGHLYVYPFVTRADATSEVPVDVYGRDGERLFAGTMVNRRWQAAHGSFVYDLERDPETQEVKVVRYRLVEPF